jgi:predicted nucleotidyltransferase/uncharacterized protein (UPF0332 family)
MVRKDKEKEEGKPDYTIKPVVKSKHPLDNIPLDLPDEAKKKLEGIKDKLDKFSKRIIEKFEDYVFGVALLPPKNLEKEKDLVKQQENRELSKKEEEDIKNQINVMVLIDDTDSKKMTKEELKEKLTDIINKTAEDIDKSLCIETILLSEVWQSCYDAKYDLLQMIATSAPVYDKGMMAAIKIAEVHKEMVLKKFEKYIVSYVLAGSLVQGRATPQSDIDVFIVIDDTDVKKMTRAELKDRLRGIIIGMGIDAGKITGVENKINIQVYILTDFWESIKEANPVIFTFLRDGVPFYDRGIFMPWKQLLQMGRVKPSQEAIDLFMHSGTQILERIQFKLKDIAMEDLFWAILTPSQAALMLYGFPPPTPKETPDVLRDVFVKKEKLMDDSFVKMLEKNIQIRKEMEHGTKKNISGEELDELIKNAENYLKMLEDLFKKIQALKEEEAVVHLYENTVTIVRDVLRLEGVTHIEDEDVSKTFQTKLVHKGIIPEKFLRILKETIKAKEDYDAKKLSKHEVQNVLKQGNDLIRFLIEHIQRTRGRELERAKIRVKHGKTFGEVLLLDTIAFIIHDIDHEQKEISVADVDSEGHLHNIKESSLEEMEKHLMTMNLPPKVFIKEKTFEDLKMIFGKDVEILVNY